MKYHLITVVPDITQPGAVSISDVLVDLDHEPVVQDGVLVLRDEEGLASLLPPGAWRICERVRKVLTPPPGLILPNMRTGKDS